MNNVYFSNNNWQLDTVFAFDLLFYYQYILLKLTHRPKYPIWFTLLWNAATSHELIEYEVAKSINSQVCWLQCDHMMYPIFQIINHLHISWHFVRNPFSLETWLVESVAAETQMCKICGQIFTSQLDLHIHVDSIHQPDNFSHSSPFRN